MTILRFVKKSHWLLVALMGMFITLQVWLDLSIPGYMSRITVLLNDGSPASDIFNEGKGMMLCSLGSVVCSVCAGGLAAYVAAEFARRVRREQFLRVQSFSPEEMGRFNTYSLITRSTNDVTQVQTAFARTSQLFVKIPVMAYIALGKIATGSIEWTEVTALGIGSIIIVQAFMLIYVIPRYRKVQKYTDKMNKTVREGLTGVRVIRAFNAEEYQNRKADSANDELTQNNLFASRLLAFTRPFNGVVQNLLTVAIYLLGAGIILNATTSEEALFTFSNMVVFSSYVMYMVTSFILLAHIAMGLPRALVSAGRINEVINTEITIRNGEIRESGKTDICISFENVDFAYPGSSDNAVSGITFDIKRGETVAIVGQTGSGKTSIINLIPRLFDITGGSLKIDGVEVREYDMETLRSKIGFATQKPILFSGSARFNIGYGRVGCNDDEMMEAARIACIDEFLNENGGLDMEIQQRGANLSGGQKQRISIARAICKKPEIYIFDDTFSALDFRTDTEVRSSIRKETEGATSIIVSQRISTVSDADKIVVIADGRMAGIGNHSELMKNCPIYREMAELQGLAEAVQ